MKRRLTNKKRLYVDQENNPGKKIRGLVMISQRSYIIMSKENKVKKQNTNTIKNYFKQAENCFDYESMIIDTNYCSK